MYKIIPILLLFLSVNANAQDGDQKPENGAVDKETMFVKVDSSSPEAVMVDGTDFFEQQPLGRLLQNQKVTLLGEEDGEYVKIRAVVDGKEIEGWIKKIALIKKPLQNEPRVSESGATETASFGSNGSVGRINLDGNDPWKAIDLTGAEAKVIHGGIPIWIPIAGGAALIGAGALLLIDEDDPTEPSPTHPTNPCTATFTIATTPAICGLPIGTASLQYPNDTIPQITWQNGETTPTISALPSGNIYAALTYANGECTDTIHANITAATHNFSITATPVKPGCTTIGDLAITYNPLPDAPATITIEGPLGSFPLPNPPPAFLLSEFFEPIPGPYTVAIALDNTTECTDSAEAAFLTIPLPSLTITDIFQPSGPGIADGAILLQVAAGILPWTLYLNDLPIQSGEEPFAAIVSLSEGTYTIELADGRGCLTPPQTVKLSTSGCPPRPPRNSFNLIITPLIPARIMSRSVRHPDEGGAPSSQQE
jgi:hypothetical protein